MLLYVQSHSDATRGYLDQLQDQAFDTLKGTDLITAAAAVKGVAGVLAAAGT